MSDISCTDTINIIYFKMLVVDITVRVVPVGRIVVVEPAAPCITDPYVIRISSVTVQGRRRPVVRDGHVV